MPNPSILVLKHERNDFRKSDGTFDTGYQIVQQVDSPGGEFPVNKDLMWISDDSLNPDSDYASGGNFFFDNKTSVNAKARNKLKRVEHPVEVPLGLSDSDINALL